MVSSRLVSIQEGTVSLALIVTGLEIEICGGRRVGRKAVRVFRSRIGWSICALGWTLLLDSVSLAGTTTH